ncbi:hypothetical protein D8674_036853 [Pyrus ussuriensis x Pyrus communis]|uniref:Uncharacterized protein n=1 Tax=Pyrus ussuriensis x Pyrus communis TaxID=2448454 RepID=A0A5N5GA83_9ROSA|nr:hypothetical protein D8674_036853 [Pyrus ussuriensis x Pyrus communis]
MSDSPAPRSHPCNYHMAVPGPSPTHPTSPRSPPPPCTPATPPSTRSSTPPDRKDKSYSADSTAEIPSPCSFYDSLFVAATAEAPHPQGPSCCAHGKEPNRPAAKSKPSININLISQLFIKKIK